MYITLVRPATGGVHVPEPSYALNVYRTHTYVYSSKGPLPDRTKRKSTASVLCNNVFFFTFPPVYYITLITDDGAAEWNRMNSGEREKN